MTTVLYWDEQAQVQKEREATAFDRLTDAAPVLVPAEVSMAQARLALLATGQLDQVQAAIDALPEDERAAASIKWEFAGTVRRADPFTQLLATALGLDDTQLDDLFIAASGM